MAREKDFPNDVKLKSLLWCDRHCCLCKRPCGLNIEVHHIDPDGGNGIDNAIPLCFDCHGIVENYNPKHPKGTKFKYDEMRKRRDQIYEEFTRQLVPKLSNEITQKSTDETVIELPAVRFNVFNHSNYPPARAYFKLTPFLGNEVLKGPSDGLYAGTKIWHLNPESGVNGFFKLPNKITKEFMIKSKKELSVKIEVKIIDLYEKEHKLLPIGWVYKSESNSWYFEPSLVPKKKKS